jgi:hypothetical protein
LKSWDVSRYGGCRIVIILSVHLSYRLSSCLSVHQQTLTFVLFFDWWVLGLSHFTCVFLLARPFIWYHDLDPLIFDLLFENFNLGHKHMQNTFFECSASLKFLMRQKKECQFWNLWQDPFWVSQSSIKWYFTHIILAFCFISTQNFGGVLHQICFIINIFW